MSNPQNKRLQSARRLVPSEKRKRALFSCDRCKLRKTKCNRIQNNDLKYDNITPCSQCTKAGVSCTTSIPRKKRFYGPVKNIALHYKCLLALVTGLFPDSDVYNIEEVVNIGHKLKFEMPDLDDYDDLDKLEKESFEKLKREANRSDDDTTPITVKYEPIEEDSHTLEKNSNKINIKKNVNEETDTIGRNTISSNNDQLVTIEESEKSLKLVSDQANSNNTLGKEMKTIEDQNVNKEFNGSEQNGVLKLPPGVKLKNNVENERLIIDKFGHTHFIGNFGTASLLGGLCDIIIKRSYNQKNPPTSTQDIRDSSVQTITSENVPIYQYPTHLYNLDTMNIDRFPLINIMNRTEADIYVNVFFEKVHPYYFIFNELRFREKYEIFWEELNDNTYKENNKASTTLRLNSAEICIIYTVWILGGRFQLYSDSESLPQNSVIDEDVMGKLIDIVKLSLSDIVLTPSIDGIRLLILFSVYLSSIKVRESGYCLMELAAIQAKSLGLHRKSIVNKFNDQKSDVMKRIMWTLTRSETTLCCSFGRASAIPWEEIDIDFPNIEDEHDELFKIYYLQTCKLTKIIFEILEYKKKTQKDTLSLVSIEKALYLKKRLEKFWDDIPDILIDYKSLPVTRYKPKLHIQYHFYYITLTLPLFLYIVNSHHYIVKNDDPFLSLLVCGIKSSFKTAELVSYSDSKGLFNGTLYYDVFYCYNAIMVLTLTYILFKSSQPNKGRQIIDLDNLNSKYDINIEEILKSINLIRKLILKNLYKIDGTMKRMCDIIETLLGDLGIIQTLVKKYNAQASNVRNIEDRNESGGTSVTSIPSSYRNIKISFNKHGFQKKKRSSKVLSSKLESKNTTLDEKINALKNSDTVKYKVKKSDGEFTKFQRSQSHPGQFTNDNVIQESSNFLNEKAHSSDNVKLAQYIDSDTNTNYSDLEATQLPYFEQNNDIFTEGIEMSKEQDSYNTLSTSSTDINDVLNSMSLNTDLMDALFGTDLFNLSSDMDPL